MNEFDIKRLGLILAIQAEIEGMKALNATRHAADNANGYGQQDFDNMAEQLRDVVHKHNDQL